MDDRKLYLGAVVGVAGPRLRTLPAALEAIRTEVDRLLAGDALEGAPFGEVHLTVYLGERTDPTPRYGSIAVGGLPISIELAYETLRALPGADELTEALRGAVLDALVSVADRFGLRVEALRAARRDAPRGTDG